jgi:hypothetical protein
MSPYLDAPASIPREHASSRIIWEESMLVQDPIAAEVQKRIERAILGLRAATEGVSVVGVISEDAQSLFLFTGEFSVDEFSPFDYLVPLDESDRIVARTREVTELPDGSWEG